MGIFNKLNEPIFLKSDSAALQQLQNLKELEEATADEEIRQKIQRDIKCLERGIKGEDNIEFELRNSGIPM